MRSGSSTRLRALEASETCSGKRRGKRRGKRGKRRQRQGVRGVRV